MLSFLQSQKTVLASAITELSAQSDLDDLGKDMLTAAIALRDSTGRGRK